MARYRQGLSIEALRTRYIDDAERLPPSELALLYGSDLPRFVADDAAARMRPTSFHLRAPLYEDAQGRQYTPTVEPRTDSFWLRIPPRFARRYNRDPFAAETGSEDAPWREFPRPDDRLLLRFVQYGNRAARESEYNAVSVRVHLVMQTRAVASAYVVFDHEIDSTRPAAQENALEERMQRDLDRRRRAETDQARRRAERGDRTYG
jgi:hypothetical protein